MGGTQSQTLIIKKSKFPLVGSHRELCATKQEKKMVSIYKPYAGIANQTPDRGDEQYANPNPGNLYTNPNPGSVESNPSGNEQYANPNPGSGRRRYHRYTNQTPDRGDEQYANPNPGNLYTNPNTGSVESNSDPNFYANPNPGDTNGRADEPVGMMIKETSFRLRNPPTFGEFRRII